MKLTYLSLALNVVTLCGLLAVAWAYRGMAASIEAREQRLALHWQEIVKLQQSQVALAAHQSLTQCRCEQPGEAEPCPICGGSGELDIDTKEGRIPTKCSECDGTGKRMKFGAERGRILPDTREALARALEILEKVNRIVDDIDAGRIGAHVDGSLWKGTADISLRRQP